MAKKFKLDWSKIQTKIEEEKGKKFEKDDRYYRFKLSNEGSFEAVIRLLPSPDTDVPYVKLYSHGFQENDRWYIQNCPTTHGEECPVCSKNRELWDTDKVTVRRRKRKLHYFSNIYIVKDPQNPENEGKVFLFKYGKKIHEKIMEKLSPGKDSIDDPVMVFDYYDGANFKLKIKLIKTGNDEYPNYDSSSFAEPSPIFKTDEEIEVVNNKLFKLSDIISKENFEDLEKLTDRFNFVTKQASSLNVRNNEIVNDESAIKEEDDVEDSSDEIETDDDFIERLKKSASS